MRLGTAYLRELFIDVRSSYWFIPGVLVLCAIALAQVLGWIDSHPTLTAFLPDTLFKARAEDARATLSVIASASIGVAGVMFSITIVAVTFASGQHGPRLVGNFMRDRGAQWTLGVLMATFVYALMVLRAVEGAAPGAGEHAWVPQISLWMALILSLLSVATTIFYIHHVPETINISGMIASLGHRLCERSTRPDLVVPDAARGLKPERDQPVWEVAAGKPGHVRAVDPEGMAELAIRESVRITLVAPPGSFVSAAETLFSVEGCEPSGELADELRKTVAIGETKTEEQNTLFLVEQLVEITARALSPGVNDPYTAVYCMNWIHAALIARLGSELEHDAPEAVDASLLVLPSLDWPKLLEASLGACLPYARHDPIARNALSKLLQRLHDATSGEHREAVDRLIRQLESADD